MYLPGELIYIGKGSIYYDTKDDLKLTGRPFDAHYEALDAVITANPDKYRIACIPELIGFYAESLEGRLNYYFHDIVGLAYYDDTEKGQKFFYNRRPEKEYCKQAEDFLNLKEFKYESC